MMRNAKAVLLTLMLSGLLYGCEDKKCMADLAACKAATEAGAKGMEALKAESDALKAKAAQVDQLTAKVQELAKENEALKAAPPPAAAKPAAPKKK